MNSMPEKPMRLSAIRRTFLTFFLLTVLSAPVMGDDRIIPTFAEVKARHTPSEAWLLDRNGAVLAEKRMDRKVRRLEWARLDGVSPAILEILVISEDKDFYSHSGVNWKALFASAWLNIWHYRDGKHPRGASTITMQLAGFLDPTLETRGLSRTLPQKWDQIMAARSLGKTWAKQEILEAYLNLAPFRGEIVGIHAVARALFDKAPSALDYSDSLLLIALLKGTAAKPQTVGNRACGILAALREDRRLTCDDLRKLAEAVLASPGYHIRETNIAPHLAQKLLAVPGTRVTTTLEANLQRFSIQSLHEHLTELKGQEVQDGSVIVIDNASGDVLAYVGSSGAASDAPAVDGVQALRQAGSTLKPFLYGMVIANKQLTAASVLDDSPLQLSTPSGLYIPQDYDRDFKGPVSLRTALASSLNVPAVRTLGLARVDRFVQQLRDFGLDSLSRDGEYYGYGLALGGAEVRLAQLTNAYRALARGGLWSPFGFTDADHAGAPRQALSEQAAFIIADILSDNWARATTFGLDNPLATRVWTAVKTGTSKDMRDNWCIGFSQRYTVGVWVGNFDGAPMRDVSGVSGAAPVWRDIIHYLHENLKDTNRIIPHGVVEQQIHFAPQVEPPRSEWFVTGTEDTEIRIAAYGKNKREVRPRILYPREATIIAIDPDIPAEHQRVRFSAHGDDDITWLLDGAAVGKGSTVWWMPSPGHHLLLLNDSQGRELDKIGFDVRGDKSPPMTG
jgi:penicillin-binding protein 1C